MWKEQKEEEGKSELDLLQMMKDFRDEWIIVFILKIRK